MTYCFKCECGNKFECILSVGDRNIPQTCSCGKKAQRDIMAEHAGGGLDCLDREHWRWSKSMGVPAHQVNEFRKRFPESTYRSNGDLLIKSRSHKLKEMKKRNFYEF